MPSETKSTTTTATATTLRGDPFHNADGSICYDAVRNLSLPPPLTIPEGWKPPLVTFACTCGERIQVIAQQYARYRKEGFDQHMANERLHAWYMQVHRKALVLAPCCSMRVMSGTAGCINRIQNLYMSYHALAVTKEAEDEAVASAAGIAVRPTYHHIKANAGTASTHNPLAFIVPPPPPPPQPSPASSPPASSPPASSPPASSPPASSPPASSPSAASPAPSTPLRAAATLPPSRKATKDTSAAMHLSCSADSIS